MRDIRTINCVGYGRKVMLYQHKNDDGVMVYRSEGRGWWYRVDNDRPCHPDGYFYWEPVGWEPVDD